LETCTGAAFVCSPLSLVTSHCLIACFVRLTCLVKVICLIRVNRRAEHPGAPVPVPVSRRTAPARQWHADSGTGTRHGGPAPVPDYPRSRRGTIGDSQRTYP